MPHFN